MYGANRRAEKEKQDTHRDSTIQIYKTWEMFRKGLKVGGLKEMRNISSQRFHRKIDLSKYDAYYVDPKCTKKKIYLTFDCGYENGFTPKILDVLKRQKVVAAFL